MADSARIIVDRLLADHRIELPAAFVLDAGVIRNMGAAIVEANQAAGSGIYGCDPRDVLAVLRYSTRRRSSPERIADWRIVKPWQRRQVTSNVRRC
jgi:hypothetical protein